MVNFQKIISIIKNYKKLSNDLISNPDKVIQVHETLSIYITNEYHSLVKNNSTLLGFVKLSNNTIHDIEYQHIDLIYILPEFRNSRAIYRLLFYVKEYTSTPIIADGAIFKDGQSIIQKFLTNNLARVSILNKNTGEVSPFSGLVNDPDLCYIFESTMLGFGKQYLPESFTWYPLFNL